MVIYSPAEVGGQGVVDGFGDGHLGSSDVVFEAVLADIAQEFLELRNLDHAVAAKGIERIGGKLPLPDITGDATAKIIGRNAAISERPRADAADDRAIGVFFANCAGNDFLIIHLLLNKEGLRQIGTMEN